MTDLEIIQKTVEQNSKLTQLVIAVEECSELVQAITKIIRFGETDENLTNLAEEMADVSIVLKELEMIFNNQVYVNDWRGEKLNLLKQCLNSSTINGNGFDLHETIQGE